ncbi:hypothetical protein SBY92_002325 [Candida maltosa Xu316]
MDQKTTDKAITYRIIHIENISKSKVHQLEEWMKLVNPNKSSVDRLKKRVITEVNLDEDENDKPINTQDTFKLYLEDISNKKVVQAYEKEPLRFLRTAETTGTPLPIKLGGRLQIKQGAVSYNGALLLTNKYCNYQGINSMDTDYVNLLNDGIVQKQIDILSL